MATTRLRRTFRYPHDSDSDDPPDLDEEHQESLLKDLQTQDEATSTLYRHIFLALPLLTSLAYTPALVAASNNTSALLALLEIFVPALAAYVLYRYPVGLSGWRGYSVFFVVFGADEDPQGVQPYEREIVGFGEVLASILGVMGVVWWWKGAGEEGLWVGLPGVVYFLTLFVRQQLAPVDLEELRKARYELKGA